MLFLLLPFLFNPFGIILRWLPALYLAAWPIIIQTLGRDALMLQAIMLILFIVTCDMTREITLKLIGMDFFSLPAGLLMLTFLMSDRGSTLLSTITPVFGTLLVAIEPVFLLIEAAIVMEMINAFNKWMSSASNIRDDDPRDLASWEPPLSRGSMVMRFVIVLTAVACYIGTYLTIQESKSLLGFNYHDVPIQFNHAIALLVTLQLIALTATIYKEEGILSECAMVALVAAVPIFIASWSFNHLKAEVDSSFPWSAHSFYDGIASYFSQSLTHAPAPLQARLESLLLDVGHKLGLSMDKLTKYYFGSDFWYILGGRLVCLIWWLLRSSPSDSTRVDGADDDRQVVRDNDESYWRLMRHKWRRFNSRLPISRRTLIKILFVLAYAQMLVQQMENKQNLVDQNHQLLLDGQQLGFQSEAQTATVSSCCATAADDQLDGPARAEGSSTSWLACIWDSAKACARATSRAAHEGEQRTLTDQQGPAGTNRVTRFMEALLSFFAQLTVFLVALLAYASARLASLLSSLHVVYNLWLLKWRSPIIQRLMQSVFIQLHYICSLTLFSGDDGDELALANDFI